MYLTWPSFNNIRLLLMAFMPVVIFYLIWLVNTSESIRSEEGTLLDLVCWPDGNAIPVIIACASIIAVVVEVCYIGYLCTYVYNTVCVHIISLRASYAITELGRYQTYRRGIRLSQSEKLFELLIYLAVLIIIEHVSSIRKTTYKKIKFNKIQTKRKIPNQT